MGSMGLPQDRSRIASSNELLDENCLLYAKWPAYSLISGSLLLKHESNHFNYYVENKWINKQYILD